MPGNNIIQWIEFQVNIEQTGMTDKRLSSLQSGSLVMGSETIHLTVMLLGELFSSKQVLHTTFSCRKATVKAGYTSCDPALLLS